jgi:adenosine kinase
VSGRWTGKPTAGAVVVTGSVAYDYIMSFPGKFADVVVPDRLHRLSVSFLVDEMRKVRGGVAPNIAYNLALLGARASVLASAGVDAADYRDWLRSEGVDVTGFIVHPDIFTASFFVSTDQDQNQIATFFAGAMARAAALSFRSLGDGDVALAVISPNDPAAMVAHARECRALGIPFVFDPSQQLARLSKEEILEGIEGASILIGNEYEFGILEKKTGLSEVELLARVPVVIITRGEEGSTIALRGGTSEAPAGAVTMRIPPASLRGEAVDPTGVGDAFRAGLIASRMRGLPWEVAGRVGSVAAVFALESPGPQPARYEKGTFVARYQENFTLDGSHAGVADLWTAP